jgi:ribosomal protein S5
VKAAMDGLAQLKTPEQVQEMRGQKGNGVPA